MTYEELYMKYREVVSDGQWLFKKLTRYSEELELSELTIEDLEDVRKDPDKAQVLVMMARGLERINTIASDMNCLSNSADAPHRITYNHANGRYCIGDRELHCGNCFEILVHDPCLDCDRWKSVRIEATYGKDYPNREGWYLIEDPYRELEGLLARFRWFNF